jgi:hypothetical protein
MQTDTYYKMVLCPLAIVYLTYISVHIPSVLIGAALMYGYMSRGVYRLTLQNTTDKQTGTPTVLSRMYDVWGNYVSHAAYQPDDEHPEEPPSVWVYVALPMVLGMAQVHQRALQMYADEQYNTTQLVLWKEPLREVWSATVNAARTFTHKVSSYMDKRTPMPDAAAHQQE